MSVPIMNQAARVLDALEEGMVGALIYFYDKGLLAGNPAKTREENLASYLEDPERGFGWPEEKVNYWLDFFDI